jgi:hypothetical protein
MGLTNITARVVSNAHPQMNAGRRPDQPIASAPRVTVKSTPGFYVLNANFCQRVETRFLTAI